MDIVDLSQFTKKTNHRNKNRLSPQWPFRALVIGPSGCGKTNMILNLIIGGLDYDRFYLFAKDLGEGLYEDLLIPFMESKQKEDPEFQFGFFDSLEPLDGIEFDRTKQNLILFDDFVNEMKQTSVVDLFTKGRKLNCSTIYLTQDYHQVHKTIRLNCNYFCIFRINTKREMTLICSAHATCCEYAEFKKLYIEATLQRYDFLLIDKNAHDICMQLRKNFDELLIK
jgi:GTPase SAR1 family protein